MGADLSRVLANPLHDYAGVRLQQGAVLLDADFNELVDVVDRRFRALASDVLDRSRVSSTTPDAFRITAVANGLQIGPGRLYVDGLLAENHGAASTDPAKRRFDDLLAEPAFVDPIAYSAQPYLPNPPALPSAGLHLVYLDVWNREVTYVEEPALVESALGVPASARVQTVWQVRVLGEEAGNATCDSPDDDVPGWGTLIAPSSGVLTTGTFDVPPSDDPCELPPSGGYRGLENQLYRVEVHDAGQPGGGATFKWSRENVSVVASIVTMIAANELELDTLGRDDVLRFTSGDWVEIVDDVREFSQLPGEMRKITVDEATRRITLNPALPADMVPASFPDSAFPVARHMRVRRWDQKGAVFRADASGTAVQIQDLDAPGSTGVIAIPADGSAILVESGLTVSFATTGPKGFRAGDHWEFAARTADASVELLDRAPPRGIHHHYERLALWNVDPGTVTDCRHHWPPESGGGQDCACTVCVTVESHRSGTLTIQDAVDKVQQSGGGTVCIGPGLFPLREPVRINHFGVRIRGHGSATAVIGPNGAFVVRGALAVAIEDMTIVAQGVQCAITIESAFLVALRRLLVDMVSTSDDIGAAISLAGAVSDVTICDNLIRGFIGIGAADAHAVPANPNTPPLNFLLLASALIACNTLSCRSGAISLVGNVMHLSMTRISGNEVSECIGPAINALGFPSPGATMSIDDNTLVIGGVGIRASVSSLRIEGNRVVSVPKLAGASIGPVNGIWIAPGPNKDGAVECQILGNQVSGFPGAGIEIGTPTRELIVKLNIVERCGDGIVASGNSATDSVSIENNHLRDIGGSRATGTAPVAGISVVRADAVTIAGNTIRGIGVQALQAALRTGVVTFAVARPRVVGNEIAGIAPAGDFVGTSAGIMLRFPYLEYEVSHNDVRRDEAPVSDPGNGAFTALFAASLELDKPVTRMAAFATVRVDERRLLVFGAGPPYVATFGDATGAAPAAFDTSRATVHGNVFSARGVTAAVAIVATDECVFSDNRVELRARQAPATVLILSTAAIVNGNRVRGPDTLSIVVAGVKLAAVVGNITSGKIMAPNDLQPPWDALNLRG